MPRTQHNRRRMGGKNDIINVRQVDPAAGSDGTYVDRCIASLQNSHSQITVLVQDSFNINSATTAVTNSFSGAQVVIMDDFVSLAQQFETFRIRAIRFDVYDINPSNAVVGWFSTFHDQFTAANQPSFAAAGVIDGPDSALVPPGTGKATFYWRARGTLENQFVTDSTTGSVATQFFGGLRIAVAAGTANPKFQLVIKALVDFRGRD